MLQSTFYSEGKNEFKDYTFSAREWSAPTIVDPKETKERLADLRLEGRVIKRMKFIGLSYYHVRDWIESHAYDVMDQLDEEERQKRSDYNNISPDILFGRHAEIDEPLLIKFEDNDVFEIDTPQEPEFCFSMNCIPWWIHAGTNLPNLDANIFFAPCIGRTITAVEVNTYSTDKDPMFNTFFDEEHSTRELVSNIVLRLDDGNGISIGGSIDYCDVALIDQKKQLLTIPFQELKPALFNWEDLHIDPETGFEAESPTFFFGSIGSKHAGSPYMTLAPDEKESSLHISYTDFLLFEWAITWQTKDFFDEYGEYEFNANQWESILKESGIILSYNSFDDLYDYLTGHEIKHHSGANVFRGLLNANGAKFWKYKDKYRIQLNDMREWTKLVLANGETMKIYGF